MQFNEFNKEYVQFSAECHLENVCQRFLTEKFGKFNEADHYLVESLANGKFEFSIKNKTNFTNIIDCFHLTFKRVSYI